MGLGDDVISIVGTSFAPRGTAEAILPQVLYSFSLRSFPKSLKTRKKQRSRPCCVSDAYANFLKKYSYPHCLSLYLNVSFFFVMVLCLRRHFRFLSFFICGDVTSSFSSVKKLKSSSPEV